MHPENTQVTIQKMLTTTPPAFSAEEAVSVAARHFGIQGKTRPLVSERDQNFRLDADDGNRYTLKISNAAEQLQVIDFQNRALLYVEKQDDSLPLPRVIPTLDGKLHCSVEHNGKTHFVRVLTWLEGMLLDDAVVNTALANRLGRLLARVNLALKDFDHPGSNPPSLWDMKRAAGLRDLLPYIKDPELGQLICQALDKFVSAVKPTLDTLRSQVIHSDMNLGNVLVDKAQPDRIVGLIDFGDMVKSPLIIDLAVAAAYQLSDGDDPLSGALPMIAGYHAICPLQNREMELLTDLIRTRLVTSLLIGSYRVTLFPENREYLMISHAPAINYLTNLSRLSADESLRRIRAACISA
jgi:hydroxylysine kinase